MDRDTKWKLVFAAFILGGCFLCVGLIYLNATIFYTSVPAIVMSSDGGQCRLTRTAPHTGGTVVTRIMPCNEAVALHATDRYGDYTLIHTAALTYSFTAPSDGRVHNGAGHDSWRDGEAHHIPAVGETIRIRVNKTDPQDSYVDIGNHLVNSDE